MAKGIKLKIRKFLGLIPAFVEVPGEKMVGGTFFPPILNRLKNHYQVHVSEEMQLIGKT